MNKKNYIEAAFPNLSLFVDPSPNYNGSWEIDIYNQVAPYDITKDMLWLNSKQENGKNKFETFLEKYFYRKIYDFIQSESVSQVFAPNITSNENKDGMGRSFYFDTFQNMLFLTDEELKTEEEKEELKNVDNNSKDSDWEYLKTKLKKKRSFYFDIQRNKQNSPFYNEFLQEYTIGKKQDPALSIDEFLEGRISAFTKLIISIKYLKDFDNKKIPMTEFIDCFDYDKLNLCCLLSTIQQAKIIDESIHKLPDSFTAIFQFIEQLKLIWQIDPKYNIKIDYYDSVKREYQQYDLHQLVKDYKNLLIKHPELKVVTIPTNYTDEDLTNIHIINKLKEELSSDQARKALEVSWTILSPETKSKKEKKVSLKTEEETKEENKKEKTQLELEEAHLSEQLIYRKRLLEQFPYLCWLKGKESFDGYIGYIYPNGNVIFEQFYKSFKNYRPLKYGATYIMDLYHFIELSQLGKSEIIEIINNTENPHVQRLYHQKNWDRNLISIITEPISKEQKEENQAYIEKILNEGKIKQKETEGITKWKK